MRASGTLAVVALLVLAGCVGVFGGSVDDGGTPTAEATPTTEATPTQAATSVDDTADPTGTTSEGTTGGDTMTREGSDGGRRPPPGSDVVGYEDGYWYDDPLAVDLTPGDGFNDSEFRALKNRTKARVEFLRDREFEGQIEFRFITREEVLSQEGLFQFREYPPRDQLWEATFVVGEDRTVATALEELYRDVVDGYSTGGEVVLVAEDPESPRVDPATLVHELAHEVAPPANPNRELNTWDDRATMRGVHEGTANFVERRYLDRCEDNWSCVPRPDDAGVVEHFDADMGLFLWFAAPYTLGPDLMTRVYERGGNDAIDARFTDPPASMEQFVHPGRYPEDEPVDLDLADRSGKGWEPMNAHRDELGEVILYAALKANGVIGGPDPRITEDQRTGLNYSHPATTGWEGDAFLAYESGDGEGYVFATEWESPADAREFRRAWVELIRTHGGQQVREGVYRIDSGPFADAFRVGRTGSRVVVVNAPTVDALDEVRETGG